MERNLVNLAEMKRSVKLVFQIHFKLDEQLSQFLYYVVVFTLQANNRILAISCS